MSDWALEEVVATVEDYFDMLEKELRGEPYVKARHNAALRLKLSNRSKGAVEFKYQNISAALTAGGYLYINGYKPMANYQVIIPAIIEDVLRRRPSLLNLFRTEVETAIAPAKYPTSFQDAVVPPPEVQPWHSQELTARRYQAHQYNFPEIEARNRKLGQLGERFVIELEKKRLTECGQYNLARQVTSISNTEGDGAGYDVLSFSENGDERYVEVKTTNCGQAFPFYISENEVNFSRDRSGQYYLYRVFQFRIYPRLFILRGAIDQHCRLTPVLYRAGF